MTWLVGGESGFLAGFLVGLAVGIFLCRWLWVNGQKTKMRLRRLQDGD